MGYTGRIHGELQEGGGTLAFAAGVLEFQHLSPNMLGM